MGAKEAFPVIISDTEDLLSTLVLVMLGIKPRLSSILDECCTTKWYPISKLIPLDQTQELAHTEHMLHY